MTSKFRVFLACGINDLDATIICIEDLTEFDQSSRSGSSEEGKVFLVPGARAGSSAMASQFRTDG